MAGSSKPPAPSIGSSTRRRIGRVLIIDDEVEFGEVVKAALADAYEVVSVNDAVAALWRLESGDRYDVVLCDVMMPAMDGIELHRRLMTTEPVQAERIVFMSGGAATGRVESFFRRVPNLLLAKPLDPEGLRALVDRRTGAAPLARKRTSRA